MDGSKDALRSRVNELRAVLADLADGSPCDLDHDGNCQEHAWFGDGECPHARAKRLL